MPLFASRNPIVRGAIVLVAALVLQLAFVGSYVGALHEPTPHAVPVTVVGPQQLATQLNGIDGEPLKAATAGSFDEARQRVAERKSYAVLVPGDRDAGRKGDAPTKLYVATAANRTMATVLPNVFDRIERQRGGTAVQVQELAPLPAGDSNGLSGFYAVVSWMVGGYFGATLIGMVGRARSRDRRFALYRLGGMLAFGIVSGLLSTMILHGPIGVLHGNFLVLSLIGALCVFAVGASTIAFQSVLGIAGTGLAVLIFVVLGNPSSGGPYSYELLPGFWHAIGQFLPPGAGTTLVRNVSYFDGHATGGALIVLLVWAALGVIVTLVRGGRVVTAEEAERDALAGIAGV